MLCFVAASDLPSRGSPKLWRVHIQCEPLHWLELNHIQSGASFCLLGDYRYLANRGDCESLLQHVVNVRSNNICIYPQDVKDAVYILLLCFLLMTLFPQTLAVHNSPTLLRSVRGQSLISVWPDWFHVSSLQVTADWRRCSRVLKLESFSF